MFMYAISVKNFPNEASWIHIRNVKKCVSFLEFLIEAISGFEKDIEYDDSAAALTRRKTILQFCIDVLQRVPQNNLHFECGDDEIATRFVTALASSSDIDVE